MKMNIRFALVLIVLAVVGTAVYFWSRLTSTNPTERPPMEPSPTGMRAIPSESLPVDDPSGIRHPIPTQMPSEASSLAVKDGDGIVGRILVELVGARQWKALFLPEHVVRRIVATVDNLPRNEAPVKMWPVRAAGSWFATVPEGDALRVSPENAKRYIPYLKLLQALDTDALVTAYVRLYPLFQQAYVDLGYPSRYFNDRLVLAIDDLLASPEPAGPLYVVQTKVRFEFVDPDLDGRSAGQKIMLRIGNENARLVKAKLIDLRRRLVRLDSVPVTEKSSE